MATHTLRPCCASSAHQRNDKMKKWIFKMLMPKPEQLAKLSAKAVADFVNSSSR